MHVYCSTCGKSWDTHHLRHGAVFQTDLSREEAEAWLSLPRIAKLTNQYRQRFQTVGYQFGQSVINVMRCPACPKDALPNPYRVSTKAALEDLLGDDEDGLAATFEDYRL